jgi:hypothetical protein
MMLSLYDRAMVASRRIDTANSVPMTPSSARTSSTARRANPSSLRDDEAWSSASRVSLLMGTDFLRIEPSRLPEGPRHPGGRESS